ncbi:MAG: methyltransferase domain-containing protein [Cyclobacteriaceae bacterium]|nr:methyltransferase domain-containing protein [Cyclobacteriaceae bacterium]
MPNFKQRSDKIEIMDDLQCRGEVVEQTLRELDFINRWLGGNQVTLSGLSFLLQNKKVSKTYKKIRLTDIGCGGGDMLKCIHYWGLTNGIQFELVGIDANPHIVNYAKKNCAAYNNINFECIDIQSDEFQNREFDIIISSLFFHHFHENELISFLRKLESKVSIGLIINDLHRHWLAYYSIKWITGIFSKSKMVRYDAPLSVLRGFNKTELEHIMKNARYHIAMLKWKWAFRWLMVAQSPVSETLHPGHK